MCKRVWQGMSVCVVVLTFCALLPTSIASAADPLGQITVFSAGLSKHSSPGAIAVGSDGNLWFTDDSNKAPAIGRITPKGKITEFRVGLTTNTLPVGPVVGPDGNLWFSDPRAAAVGRVTPNGKITEFGLSPETEPSKLVIGSDGNIWFNENGMTPAIGRMTLDGTITEFSTQLGGYCEQFTGMPGEHSCELGGIAAGPDGNIWFTTISGAIGRITPSGAVTEFNLRGPYPRSYPEDLVASSDGNLWFTDIGTPAIGRITPGGSIAEFSAGLNPGARPAFIMNGPDGNVWFTDSWTNPGIGRITPDGALTEFSLPPHGHSPGKIVSGPDGNLWFTDEGAPAIGRITPSGTHNEFHCGIIGVGQPSNIVAGPDGNMWFTADYEDNGGAQGGFIGRVGTKGTSAPRRCPLGQVHLNRLKKNLEAGTVTLVVKVSGAGIVKVHGNGVKTVRRKTSQASIVTLPVKAAGKAAKKLRTTGKVKVKAIVAFTPTSGLAKSFSRTITLKARRRHFR